MLVETLSYVTTVVADGSHRNVNIRSFVCFPRKRTLLLVPKRMPVSAKTSDVLYNATTGRRTISSATRLERTSIVRTSAKGTFLTSSADVNVRSAVDLLNSLKSGTKAFGQVSSLIIPKLIVEGGSSTAVLEPAAENPPVATPSADPRQSTRPTLGPLIRRPPSATTAPTMLTWHMESNVATDQASSSVEAAIANRRVTPLEMHRTGERISVEPAVVLDVGGKEDVGPVPNVSLLKESLKQEADWMRYWGNLERMHLFHKSLISRLTDAEATAAREHGDVAWMHEKLQGLLRESFTMDEVMRQHQALAEEAVRRERGRQDSLMEHNELLNAKIVEMRRQVALTERSAHLLRGELDATVDVNNKLKNDLEGIQNKHRIDLLQLRRELAPDEAGDRLRRLRLETLEGETARKDEMLATLQTTLDVLEEEKRRLAEKVASLSAAAEMSHKNSAASSHAGSAVDAVTIQNMTARQYQRREAELVASNTELRQGNAALEVGVDTLKDRLMRYTAAVELDRMRQYDPQVIAPNASEPLLAAQSRSPNVASSKKGTSQRGAPASVQYVCSPLVFPDVGSALNKAAVTHVAPTGTPAAVVELRSRLVLDAPAPFLMFSEAAGKLWGLTEKSVAEHPKRDPSGERELTHAWIVKATDNMAQALSKLVADCNHAVTASAAEVNERVAAAERELAATKEQHALAMTSHNARMNELYDEVELLKQQLTTAAAPVVTSTPVAQAPPTSNEHVATQTQRLVDLVHKFAQSTHVALPAPTVPSAEVVALDTAVGLMHDLLTSVVKKLSEAPTEVPTAMTSPKKPSAEAVESQRRAQEQAIASQKAALQEQAAAADTARALLEQRLATQEAALKGKDVDLKRVTAELQELQSLQGRMALELAAARSEAAAAAAVRSAVTSPTTKSIKPLTTVCAECGKLREELRLATQYSTSQDKELIKSKAYVATLEHERAELIAVTSSLSHQLAKALEDNSSQRAVDSHRREKWDGSASRPTSAAGAPPQHNRSPSPRVQSFPAPVTNDLSTVAAMRQRIRHDRAPLVSSASARAHDVAADASILRLELDPDHSIAGNTVYYAQTPVEPQYRPLDVLHYMKSLKDAEFLARTPSPVPPAGGASHAAEQFSPVPFFEVFGLPRAPSPAKGS